MNIVIIGSGGREHALCYKLLKSLRLIKYIVYQVMLVLMKLRQIFLLDINDFDEIYKIVLKLNVELIVVGPEIPLVNGIVDFLRKKI